MLKDQIESLKELKNALSEDSCIQKEPFIKLGTGQAPILNYNIPQTASFRTYGRQAAKGISPEVFLPQTFAAPANNYFATVRELDEPTLRQRFAEALQLQRTDDNLLVNSPLIRKHVNLAQSNLLAVSLGEAGAPNLQVAAKGEEPSLAMERAQPLMIEQSNAINEVQLARLAKDGVRPMVVEKFGGYETKMEFVREPVKPVPYFAIVEEYTTSSYLGDYGAGRTIKTFSLLPGERTTITVKTYKDVTTTRMYAENVLDSFSEASTAELEKNIEQESGYSESNTDASSSSSTKTRSGKVGGSVGINIGIVKIGVDGGYTGGSSSTNTNSNSATRASNVKAVNKALDKHVATSNSNRQIDVNTTTSDSSKEGEESSTVRELVNINKSRVLNFVFRQLLQQYVTITYLSNVRFAFCNGYEESLRIVELEELSQLLEDTVKPDAIEKVRAQLLKHYCNIFNYEDDIIPFIERVNFALGECVGISETETFHRIRKGIEDRYSAGGLEITVKGPILKVNTHTLKTSSVVVDALLGQGEALDCFNMKAQDAFAIGEELKNLELLQQIELVEGIEDPARKVEIYKKVFGACCDTPQTQIVH